MRTKTPTRNRCEKCGADVTDDRTPEGFWNRYERRRPADACFDRRRVNGLICGECAERALSL